MTIINTSLMQMTKIVLFKRKLTFSLVYTEAYNICFWLTLRHIIYQNIQSHIKEKCTSISLDKN